MWRFRFGHPATSVVTETVEASSAQVTAAGLEILLDEWGGNKSAKWTGITGGQKDRTRVWIETWESDKWEPRFSGVMTLRPTNPMGQREAVGDKYLRLKELPIASEDISGDAAQTIRAFRFALKNDLPHLKVPATGEQAGVNVSRKHNGESYAAAFDALISYRTDWGWTTLPDDTLYVGPKPSAVAEVDVAAAGVEVQLRDVVSTGLRTMVRWVYRRPDGQEIRHESQHPRMNELGRAGITYYITQRDLGAVMENAPATYEVREIVNGVTTTRSLTESEIAPLRDGASDLGRMLNDRLTVYLPEGADWVEIIANGPTRGVLSIGMQPFNYPEFISGEAPDYLVLYDPQPGSRVIFSYSAPVTDKDSLLYEVNPRRLKRGLLDTAATDLYHIPAQHAGTARVLGIRPPAGSLKVRYPTGEFTEKIVGTRYLIRDPMKTEYLIGEPDEAPDAQTLRVLIERRDENAVNLAVNTGGT